MCIDDLGFDGNKYSRSLYGPNGSPNRTFDLVITPCIPEQLTDKNKHLYDKGCIADYKNPDGKYGLK